MKILIGTPIHKVKDYSMERWLENVSRLEYPADLLLVDNSPGLDYVDKVKKYCRKYGLYPNKKRAFKKTRIIHIEISQSLKGVTRTHMGIEICQETIRLEVLAKDYDAWFSWECDQLIPADALDKLITIMQRENRMMVVHNAWKRNNPNNFETDMGVTLINKEALKIGSLLPLRNGKVSQNPNDMYNGNHVTLKEKVLQGGGDYVEVYGVVNPIYHLDK